MSLPFVNGPFVCLENVIDPRVDRSRRHKLVDILVIALCGFLAGCEGWVDVELFGISKRKWLEKFLELPNGIPSHDTFGRVFALLQPQLVQFQLGRGHSKVARSKLRTRDQNHGRKEQRTYTAMAAPPAVRRHWPDAQSIVRVCRETTEQGKKTKEVRDFISSLPPQVERLAVLIRGHWEIENRLHWSLDVTFNEDQSRIRQGHAAENAALLRRLTLSILKQDTRYSDSLRCKRLRAAWENSALEHFLMIFNGN